MVAKYPRFFSLGLCVVVIFSVIEVNSLRKSCQCNVKYVKKGCYKDLGSYPWSTNPRPLNQQVLNLRSRINWREGWNVYLRNLTCSCAEKVSKMGYQYFGLQFYGECWTGIPSSDLFAQKRADVCWGYRPDYDKCDDGSNTECVGIDHYNYVYEISPKARGGCTAGTTTSLPTTLEPSTTAPPPFPACDSGPCDNGGDCVNIDSGNDYICDCPDDFRGPNCEIPV